MINAEILEILWKQLSSKFSEGFGAGETTAVDAFVTTMPLGTRTMRFDWLGDFHEFRKWVGPRIFKQLESKTYEASYDEYELSHRVLRRDIRDGIISPYTMQAFSGGEGARLLKPRLACEALDLGNTLPCYDGQNFFDTEHPIGEDGDETLVSNYVGAGGAQATHPWYVADLSRSLKPILALDREAPQYVSYQNLSDPSVFYNKEFLFGAQASMGTAYGLWQQIIRCEDNPTVQKFLDLRNLMADFRGDFKNEAGRRKKMGYDPTHVIFGASNRDKILTILDNQVLSGTFTSDPLNPGATDTAKQNPAYKMLTPLYLSWLP